MMRALLSTVVFLAVNCGSQTSPFMAADRGNLPDCQIYGRTYCLQIDSYPTDTIRYLLDNHLVDVTSIILSEGTPLMKNTRAHSGNQTHSLRFGEDGSPQSFYVQNRAPKQEPESITVKVQKKVSLSSKKSQKEEKMRPEEQLPSNAISSNLQPAISKPAQNSVEMGQPKDLNTSESLFSELKDAFSNMDKKPPIIEEIVNINDSKVDDSTGEEPFIVHAKIQKPIKPLRPKVEEKVPSAEYEPPIPSRDFNFENFQEVQSVDDTNPSDAQFSETVPSFPSFPAHDEKSIYFDHQTVKKFENPPSLSFNAIKSTTELPKYTYSIKNTPTVGSFFNEDELHLPGSEVTTELPQYTYKLADYTTTTPKKYTFHYIEDNATEPPPLPKFTYKQLSDPPSAIEAAATNAPRKSGGFFEQLHADKPPQKFTYGIFESVTESSTERHKQNSENPFLRKNTLSELNEVPSASDIPRKYTFKVFKQDEESADPPKKFTYGLLPTEATWDQNEETSTEQPPKKYTYGLFPTEETATEEPVTERKPQIRVTYGLLSTERPTVAPQYVGQFYAVKGSPQESYYPISESLGGKQHHNDDSDLLPAENSFFDYTTAKPPQRRTSKATTEPPAKKYTFGILPAEKPTVNIPTTKKYSFSVVSESKEHKTGTTEPPFSMASMATTLGYFPLSPEKDLIPDLTIEDRRKLGLFKPVVTQELVKILEETMKKIEPRDIPKEDEINQFEKIKEEINQDLQELNIFAQQSFDPPAVEVATSTPVKRVVTAEPRIALNMPSEPLNLNEPFDEFDFKPILNPPPSFYQLKPVNSNNPFLSSPGHSFTAPRLEEPAAVEYLDQSIDTISAPFSHQNFEYEDAVDQVQEVVVTNDEPPPIPDYDEAHVNYEPNYYQQSTHALREQPVAERQVQAQAGSKSDFLLKKAFRKVSNLFDNLFFRGFGLSRSRREASEESNICPTRTHFIHPKVAFSVKGQWLYIVNLPWKENQQQGIVTEECTTSECSGVCAKNSLEVKTGKCEPQFVQKRLVALHPSGHKLISELFWFPATCRCAL